MGFNVDKNSKLVTVDHSHNTYAVTNITNNPTTASYNGLDVTSVFRRTKAARREKDAPGDNSPMLYAFKQLHSLRTNYSSIASLTKNFYMILDKFIAECSCTWDIVIPMPSSHEIANIIGRRIHKKGIAKHLELGALKKISAKDAQQQVKGLQISSREKTQLNNYIKNFVRFNSSDTDFQMKSITNSKLRYHINPLAFGSLSSRHPPKKILLVDDMVTSGTTLNHARAILSQRYPFTQIEALTLFGY